MHFQFCSGIKRNFNFSRISVIQNKADIPIFHRHAFKKIITIRPIQTTIPSCPPKLNPRLLIIIRNIPKFIFYFKLRRNTIYSIKPILTWFSVYTICTISSLCPNLFSFNQKPFTINNPIINTIYIFFHTNYRCYPISTILSIFTINSVLSMINNNFLIRRKCYLITTSIR